MRFVIALAISCLTAPSALAEVKTADASGFDLESSVTVPVTPAEAYAAATRVGEWWSSDHTYSGDAANMMIDGRGGGCFCEAIPADGGSIEHGRVMLAWPGRTLRLSAALGPLQSSAVSAVLTWSFEAAEGGGTRILQQYSVSGRIPGGAAGTAAGVDQVLNEQLERFRAHLTP